MKLILQYFIVHALYDFYSSKLSKWCHTPTREGNNLSYIWQISSGQSPEPLLFIVSYYLANSTSTINNYK